MHTLRATSGAPRPSAVLRPSQCSRRHQLGAVQCAAVPARPRTLQAPALRGAARSSSSSSSSALAPAQASQLRRSLAPVPIGLGLPALAGADLARLRIVARSFLGVGAPEAILVAVVALVVFGPKGLADAAKSLGQTLRAFQPTIREVVEVSQEIKGTLEQELGIDEIRQAATMRPTPRPLPADSDGGAAASSSGGGDSTLRPVTEAEAKAMDPDIELKRAMSEQAAWGNAVPVAGSGAAAAGSGGGSDSSGGAAPAAAAKDLSKLSLEELEAELARRRNAQNTA